MPPSRLDAFYRRLLITRFFEKGWGKPENLQRLFEFRKFVSNRESCYKLVPKDYPVEIIKEERSSDCTILEGKFMTPLELHLPGLVPKAAQQAHFQVLLPNKWSDSKHKPMCIHLAGTGDHYYWRRRNFIAKPLLKEAGLGAIILENPFYGVRKPEDQIRSNLHNVSDILVMGGCSILECLVLLHWCERNGLGPLGITGLSMGGHMASLAATNWPKPLVLVPCLSWSTASTVFTQGVMSQSINWDMLETQYFADGQYRERLAKMVTVIDNAFMAGQQFVKNFNQSMKALKHDLKEIKSISDIYQNNNTLPAVQQEKRSLIKIDQRNALNLSESLHQKLTSGKQVQLFDNEIDELNDKIRSIQEKLRIKQREIDFLNNPTCISTETLLNPQEKSVVVKKVCDSPSSSSSATDSLQSSSPQVGESALTKLINYVYPKQQSVVKKSSSNASNKPDEMYYQRNQLKKIDTTKVKWWEREALQFMRGMMDECTHLKNFSVPYDTSLIIAICAKDDAYIPREGCSSLEDVWPGAEIKYLDAGHVSAYVLHQKLFRSSIIEAFERAKKKIEINGNKVDSELPDPTLTYTELYNRYQRWQSQYSQSKQNQLN